MATAKISVLPILITFALDFYGCYNRSPISALEATQNDYLKVCSSEYWVRLPKNTFSQHDCMLSACPFPSQVIEATHLGSISPLSGAPTDDKLFLLSFHSQYAFSASFLTIHGSLSLH